RSPRRTSAAAAPATTRSARRSASWPAPTPASSRSAADRFFFAARHGPRSGPGGALPSIPAPLSAPPPVDRDLPFLHHPERMLDGAHVGERIAGDGDQVGEGSGGDGAD